ncbi:hypothetical protein BDC45DRAFT_573393 [Circinella umbellata]|nr:hypothetical protein BDC45DRAFT_576192 [Circinella umbellata]KAI7850076.1 hypothetical protein BDC45DRAFT_573393 [Circinella umbellata]
MVSNSALFQPIKVGNHQLKHRFVFAPLTRFRSDENHVPTDLQAEYYSQRAIKEQINGWKKVTSAVHKKGGIIFLQLWHVGHATISHLLPNKAQPVSASNVAIQGSFMLSADKDYEVPHSLSIDEIAENHTGICQAAKNTVTAGFDGYRNPGCQCSNFRTDQYGGSTENRDRFTLEVVKAISAAIGTGRADIHLFPWSGYQVE